MSTNVSESPLPPTRPPVNMSEQERLQWCIDNLINVRNDEERLQWIKKAFNDDERKRMMVQNMFSDGKLEIQIFKTCDKKGQQKYISFDVTNYGLTMDNPIVIKNFFEVAEVFHVRYRGWNLRKQCLIRKDGSCLDAVTLFREGKQDITVYLNVDAIHKQ